VVVVVVAVVVGVVVIVVKEEFAPYFRIADLTQAFKKLPYERRFRLHPHDEVRRAEKACQQIESISEDCGRVNAVVILCVGRQ